MDHAWNPSVWLQAQGPLPCKAASIKWVVLFFLTFVIHSEEELVQSKGSFQFTCLGHTAKVRPWRSPDVQMTQVALQLPAVVPAGPQEALLGMVSLPHKSGRARFKDGLIAQIPEPEPLLRDVCSQTRRLLSLPRAAPLWPEVRLVTHDQAQGMPMSRTGQDLLLCSHMTFLLPWLQLVDHMGFSYCRWGDSHTKLCFTETIGLDGPRFPQSTPYFF